MRFKNSDLVTMQRGLRELYARHDLEALPRVILRLVERLVPADLSAYNEIDPVRRRIVAVVEPRAMGPMVAALSPDWEQCMHQHPLVPHFHQHPNDAPRRISDFLGQADFEQTDLYRRVFAPMKLRYQVVTALPVPAPLMAGVAQNRGRRNFTDRELALLDLLRPHLRQAYENACLVSELATEAQRLRHALDHMDRGLIVIDDALRVHDMSPAAQRFVQEHLRDGTATADALPPRLREWAPGQIDAMRQRDDPLARPRPLVLETAAGRLVARLIPDPQPGRYIIVVHRAASLEGSQPLRGLGLTPREAQVLHGCVEGRTRAEIGQTLGISERTVQKHLEHVYAKLNVSNRVAAVTRALEWLRL